MQKKKLLVLSSTYPRWDDDWEPAFVHELSKRLTDEFDVSVLCPREKGSMSSETKDHVNVIRYRYAPNFLSTLVSNGGIAANLKKQPFKWLLVPAFLLAQCFSTWKTIRKTQPDIVHAHWIIPQGIALVIVNFLLKNPPPFVITSHGGDLFSFRTPMFKAIKKGVLKRARSITVVSKEMKREALKLHPNTKNISVRPMGIDTRSRFFADPAAPKNRNEILFVGRLVEKKGLIYLLKALPEIIKENPETTLSIIGSGPEEDNLLELAIQLGVISHVNFMGPIKNQDLPQYYRRAAVFIAPFIEAPSGDQEGLGLVLVEALCCGTPTVVSDIPAAKDITQLLPPSDWLKIVPSKNSEAISRATSDILETISESTTTELMVLSDTLGNHFDWQTVADGYERLFYKIDDRKNGT